MNYVMNVGYPDTGKEKLSQLFFEYDELRFTILPNLESLYAQYFGFLETEIYRAQMEYRKNRKKLMLIQQSLNRNQLPDFSMIEKQLKLEFEEWEIRLKEMQKSWRAKQTRLTCMCTPEESRKIKKIYRRLVKALHPDLHPGADEKMIAWFEQAVDCYKNGDLKGLEILDSLVLAQSDSDENLQMASLEVLIAEMEQRIAKLKSQFPYTCKEMLEDEEQINAHCKELQQRIEELQDMNRMLIRKAELACMS